MTPKTSNGKDTLVEDLVKLFTKQSSMLYYIFFDAILISDLVNCLITIIREASCILPSYNMKKDFLSIGIVPIVFSHPCHQTVEPMPIMNFSDTNQMYFTVVQCFRLMQWY